MTGNHAAKPMPDRETVLRAIKAHLGDGCRTLDRTDHVECCPYYKLDPHDPPCETRLLWDIYDPLSPKPVSNVKCDGMYYYGSCPSCGMALHHNSTRSFRFCTSCGTALQWPTASETNEVPPSFP